MKILHTADWHLGKLIHGIYMTEDQGFLLAQLIDHIERERPDLIIIAGDIYDRAIPPVEAIELLNHFLNRVALELNIPIIAITGNHDSPKRLQFGNDFLQAKQCYLITELDPTFKPIILSDQFGEIHFYPIPYLEPAIVRHILQDHSITDHDSALKAIVGKIAERYNPDVRNVLILHAFVTHSSSPEKQTSDSERPLSIGGSEYVSAEYLDIFDYVALGHLHQAHYIKDQRIQYAGSLLKYSQSEANHRKAILEIELNQKGELTIEKCFLTPKRDLRTVKGYLKEILQMPMSEDYCFVTLLDETPVLQPMEQIRTVFPNAMHVERTPQNTPLFHKKHFDTPQKKREDDLTLFKGFYRTLLDKEPDAETLRIFADAIQDSDKI
ncbi:exonuclease sbcCD subunit D [Ignatzschineria ureiclastica]|uniref:Nuclease SbcCD subunit D n=1 Tax=Ignatzschineria ureiclastica TaxID=472582 RepID=A0A2U2AES9_9GAMM|nr:exonuclease SbcCD subunit D [Ignatzschineria ureiclastica]PWD81156.1 exonuclease sbcCD subunit D [Ignatzschineria ureiclastica]GGZ96702.1 nuclease SbcCD subunit D [Ignatzschineria ureiclastica]